MLYLLLFGLLVLAVASPLLAGAARAMSFARRAKAAFPADHKAILRRRLPFFDCMPQALQEQLLQLVTRFLLRKRFVGCAGLQINLEMQLVVAAYACLLLLNRKTTEFGAVEWIYLYPAEFFVRHSVVDEAGVVSQGEAVLSGEAWHDGRVILAWSEVEQGINDFCDGYNVILHEFAHQLDGESGSMNGAPLLSTREAYSGWAEVLSREYERLREHTRSGRQTALDDYGAESPAEFFAVATESFFETPAALQALHPELYLQLQAYYCVDPRQWMPAAAPRSRSTVLS